MRGQPATTDNLIGPLSVPRTSIKSRQPRTHHNHHWTYGKDNGCHGNNVINTFFKKRILQFW